MQLISLNTWGGRVPGIIPFLANKSHSTDIFCFQEVYNNAPEKERETAEERPNLFEELKLLLPEFNAYFAPQVEGVGLATFVNKKIGIESSDSQTILSAEDLIHLKMPDESNYYPRILQCVFLKQPKITIYNFHGVPGGGKVDTAERKNQTERLLNILDKDKNPKILTGDFNLNINTQAVSDLEQAMQNPLKGSSFTSTRSSLYKNRSTMPIADYSFLSPEIKVEDFQVLPDEISDHLALQLRFKLDSGTA
jgi:endonuclease/exonuclease/phosphatase family metal-dependent hydrolase